MPQMQIIEISFILLLGLCLGSFITMLSYRLPNGEDIFIKRSHCPKCKYKLNIKDLFPLFSWAFFKGKCSNCKNKISIRYPLTEIITALFCLWAYNLFGLNEPIKLSIMICLIVVLITLTIIDIELMIIPDSLQIASAILGVLWVYFNNESLLDSFYGFLIGLSIGLFFHYGYLILRKKEGLGFGDVKFFAVVGIFFGTQVLYFSAFFFLSGIIGIIFAGIWRLVNKSELFPFGPALAFSLFIMLNYGKEVSNFVINISNKIFIGIL